MLDLIAPLLVVVVFCLYKFFTEPMPIKVYPARAMTGRVKADVVSEAKADKEILEREGFIVLCPVTSENVKPTKAKLFSPKKIMDLYWPRDLEMIREANVIFNMSPNVPSIGVIREHGYGQYLLRKKVISVFPSGKMPPSGAICYYEDGHVTDSLADAIKNARKSHGTRWARLMWRLKMLAKREPQDTWHKLLEWVR